MTKESQSTDPRLIPGEHRFLVEIPAEANDGDVVDICALPKRSILLGMKPCEIEGRSFIAIHARILP